jgi:hypothetical protein
MQNIPYTSIDRIFNKFDRDIGMSFNEGDAIEWTAEALEAIGAVRQYEEAIAFIEVRNHQCTLPSGFHAIIQIARNNCFSEEENLGICAADIVADEQEQTPPGEEPASVPIAIDCDGQPIEGYELVYYRPYFDTIYEFGGWIGSPRYRTCFVPVRLADHSFFNSIVCAERDDSLYDPDTCTDEYTIIAGSTLRFSFEKGQIALSYLRQVLDPETGYPMVPDHYSYTTALTSYLIYKMMLREFYAGREGSSTRLQKAEADWHWYCKQAGNYSKMIRGIDEHQNFLEQRSYLIPHQNRYYGFFGKLSRPESRRFNDPNNTTQHSSYFRGL